MTRLGYVGLGNIGGPMATRLASDGSLRVFDLDADAVAKLVDAGATAAGSLAELAGACEVISVCVVNDEQVRTVVTELLESANADTIIAIHSTISPHTAVELDEIAQRRGVSVVDAPISGGAPGAQEGRLAIMIGGPREVYERVKPAFAAASNMVVHAGDDVGSGTRMKLARNLLHFISFAATTEASRLAEAAGIDLGKLGRVVRHTDEITGGAGALMLRDTTAAIDPDDFWYSIMSHVRDLGEKDLSLALELADELGVDLTLGSLARANLADWLGVPHTDDQ